MQLYITFGFIADVLALEGFAIVGLKWSSTLSSLNYAEIFQNWISFGAMAKFTTQQKYAKLTPLL